MPDLPCSPCRGTGNVISTEGGSPKPVTCPWCEGSGVRPPAPAPSTDGD